MTLDDLVSQLQKAYGADLRAVVLYGSAAAGEHIPNRSDYNVLVIVESLTMEHLRAEAAVARAWGDAGNPPPLTLTTPEWLSSADIFPMEYADILERHRVLHGTPPFDAVRVDREHLRLQVEREAMGKLLQLRRAILAAGGESKAQVDLLASSLSAMMVLFRAVERLRGQRPSTDYETLSTSVAGRAEFDAAPFVRVVRHVRGAQKMAPSDAGAVLEGYLKGIGRLVAYINRLGDPKQET
jgi:hypothetical protein